MKIAVTGLRGIPGVMGGVETHCEELLPRVKRLAPDAAITVFARRPYVAPGESEHRGVRILPVASPRSRSFEAIIATFNSVLAARREGAKLVHIHAIGPALLAPLARMLGLRVVVTHHGEDYRRAKWGFVARQMLRLGERFALRSADRLIAVSPSLTERLRRAYPAGAERIRFIPNGVPELPAGPGGALDRLGLTSGNYILAVGRLVPEKGLHDLVDAHARARDPRMLVIVGGADHESGYAAALRKRESQRVRFAGLQDRATVRELFEHAALFVMPSYHEGLPIAALEAASCATPMLLSDIEPNRDLGLPPNHYFPVGNVDALVERLGRPATSYAVKREAFLGAFDWDRISERTLEVYREVTGWSL
jgi:glycosyltransferase involved in cell wall biosynthesis